MTLPRDTSSAHQGAGDEAPVDFTLRPFVGIQDQPGVNLLEGMAFPPVGTDAGRWAARTPRTIDYVDGGSMRISGG